MSIRAWPAGWRCPFTVERAHGPIAVTAERDQQLMVAGPFAVNERQVEEFALHGFAHKPACV
jgi:hypothetical protein